MTFSHDQCCITAAIARACFTIPLPDIDGADSDSVVDAIPLILILRFSVSARRSRLVLYAVRCWPS